MGQGFLFLALLLTIIRPSSVQENEGSVLRPRLACVKPPLHGSGWKGPSFHRAVGLAPEMSMDAFDNP